MRIAETARKHNITDENMLHAIRNATSIARGDEFTMLIGPATDGQLLEVGILDFDGEDEVIIHAMPARTNLL